MSIAIETIIAAYKRGWDFVEIGKASGISFQAVQQRIVKWERRHGVIKRHVSRRQRRANQQFWRCAKCHKLFLSKKGQVTSGRMFCSRLCMTEFNRILTDSQIVQAIELRWAGKPWFSVKRACKASVQSVQQNIWKYLYRIEMLDLETVHSIWNRPTTYRSPGWSWLEKNTGIYVTKYGAQLGPRYESHHSTKPFGDYLRDPKQWHIEAKQEK